MAVTGDRLAAEDFGGLIKEDVMNKIFDVSKYPLVFTNRVSKDTSQHPYKEWVVDKLQDPIITNAKIDGEDTITDDDTDIGEREGNYCQISTKVVKVSTRADEAGTIGYARELANQISRRQIELRRDCEAAKMSNNASIKGVDGATAPQSAGLGAWIITNTDTGVGYTPGGFNRVTGIVGAPSVGADRAMTETMVRDVSRSVFVEGGESTSFMSTPPMTEAFSKWLFDESARVANLRSDVEQQKSGLTATGAVNLFISDFSSLTIDPNRIQQPNTATNVNAYLLDFDYLRIAYLHGFRTEPLAKNGLSDTRQIAVDWTLCVLNERAQGMITDLDPALPVTLG